MKIYTVGGAVRDSLLGLAVKDRDHVVVGATPEQMVALGYRPVGKDFPVFLHPETHEEYALARTERKTAPGYQGFAFHAETDVTLEQDLARRDLTINAIARGTDGSLTDPFGGRADLRAKIFRHVSDAFAEDPVRILRLARFAARFTEFRTAPETKALMRAMVDAGEVDALVPERVWQELARGLMELQPSRMFEVLHDCGALAHILPEFDAVWKAHASGSVAGAVAAMIDFAAAAGYSLAVRFSCMCLPMPEPSGAMSGGAATAVAGSTMLAEQLCSRLRVPNACRDLALMSAREQGAVAGADLLSPEGLVALLMRCDVFRKPDRFTDMLNVLQCGHAATTPAQDVLPEPMQWPPAMLLRGVLQAAQAVKAREVAALYVTTPERIPDAIYAARVGAVAQFRDAVA